MRIVLLAATQRGRRVFSKLLEVAPEADFTVFSFREEPWEPPFLDAFKADVESAGHEFYEGKQIGSPKYDSLWAERQFDLLLCVSWRFLVPRQVYEKAQRGAFVLHDSLLPRYRGFAPTVWAVVNGEAQTGATLLHMAEGIDEGDVVDQAAVAIGPNDCIGELIDRVTQVYLALVERNMARLLAGDAPRRSQEHSLASYTCKRLPSDNVIDWHRPALEIHNLVRAVTAPYPGAFTTLDGKKIVLWTAQLAEPRNFVGRIPGRVVDITDGQVTVLAGAGALRVSRVQRDGRPVEDAASVLRSLSMTLGR